MNNNTTEQKTFAQAIKEWRSTHDNFKLVKYDCGQTSQVEDYFPHPHSIYEDIDERIVDNVFSISGASAPIWGSYYREIRMVGESDWMDRRIASNNIHSICEEFNTTPVGAWQEYWAGIKAEKKAECITKWQNRASMVKNFFTEIADSIRNFN